MIDLHSHVLPGVDDGSRSLEQSLRTLQLFLARGITEVACTSHLEASRLERGFSSRYEAAWTLVQQHLPAGMTLHRGAEVMLDRPIPAAAAERKVTIAGTRYLLCEFQRVVPAEIVTRALDDVIRLGLIPLLAHPERYTSCTVEAVRAWREMGVLMQVDATTITQASRRGDRARDLIRHGLADIIAADNHGDDRNLGTALDWLTECGGGEQALLLLETNPRAILSDETVYEVDPLRVRTSLWRRMRRLFEEE